MDVHKLIDLPGYGDAQKELRKAGLWQNESLEEQLYQLTMRIFHPSETPIEKYIKAQEAKK